MIDHVGIPVTDFPRAKAFYAATLAPLGITLVMEFPDAAGFGANGKPFFWIGTENTANPTHIAFAAESRALVDAFHKAAMAAGAADNGGPGLRPQYHANYYGAFVHDPNGHNIEAVCHLPA